MLKLKEDVNFKELIKYGFEEDPVNCEDKEDHYYYLNNYYTEVSEDFRITINMLNRHIDILCLPKEKIVHNMWELKPLYDLIKNDLVYSHE